MVSVREFIRSFARFKKQRTCFLVVVVAACISCLSFGGEEQVAIAKSEAVKCSANTGTSTIAVSLNASRQSGVAPLAVFFDATESTASATTCAFHDLEYRWDFGDEGGSPVSGTTWAVGARADVASRNSGSGPLAAHVFERPGTYNVRLTVSDGKSINATSIRINVANPDVLFSGANTICFSNKTSFAGCPKGARKVEREHAFGAVMAYIGKGKRLLLERGGIWNAHGLGMIVVDGPGILGAFGKGPRPVVKMTGKSAILRLSGRASPTIGDWRIMDLEFAGNGGSGNGGSGNAIEGGGGIDQVTLLRLYMHDVRSSISFSESLLDYWNSNGSGGHTLWDQLAIVDCVGETFVNGGNGVFMSASRIAVLGNVFRDAVAGGHVLRIAHTKKAVISHNELSNPDAAKHAFKLHAHTWSGSGVSNPGGVGTYSEQIVISDNKFSGGTSNTAWPVAVGPQNNSSDERVRDVIFERNWHVGAPGDQLAIHLGGVSNVTIRNSVFDGSGASGLVGGIAIDRRGIEPMPDGIHIYNNTFYNSGAGKGYWAVAGYVAATNVTIKNNLAYAPNKTSPAMYAGRQGVGFVASRNSSIAQIKNSAPGWVSVKPAAPADFSLQAGSYAHDTGEVVPVRSDFLDVARPQNELFDLGAMERP